MKNIHSIEYDTPGTVAGQYVDLSDLPSNGLKMANAILATGPVILIYPFVQRYFIGGITVGAVKG